MRSRNILLVLILLLPCAAMAASQAYRWKDAEGVVHFSYKAPPQGVDYKIIDIQTGVARSPETTQSEPEEQPADAQAESSRDDVDHQEAPKAEVVAATPDNIAETCKNIAANIKMLQTEDVVVLGDRRMSEEERSQHLQDALARQQKFCTGN